MITWETMITSTGTGVITTALTAALERGIAKFLALDQQTLARLAALSGKVIKIEFSDWNATLYLFPGADGIQLQNYYEGEVDATIKGSPISLLRMSVAREEKTAEIAKEMSITGDVELAQTLNHILQQIEIDWEEVLSRCVGDTLAHQMSKVFQSFKQWKKSTLISIRRNVADYLQEESRQLPAKQEVEDFFADIAELQHDVARLEARILYKE